MRIYAALDEENLRALRLLEDWTSQGFLSKAQHLTLQEDTPCELRRTNAFLRAAFFLFTLISVSAFVGLFLFVFPIRNMTANGVCSLFVAALCYWGAETAVLRQRFYRHGVEEALAVLSVFFLCIGLDAIFFTGVQRSGAEAIVPASGALASFLIYRRFGFAYAFPAAMIFIAFIPAFWTSSHTGQHLLIAGAYTAGLVKVIQVRRMHRFDPQDDEYSISEALLWVGIYASVNLQLSSIEQIRRSWFAVARSSEFPQAFYWATSVAVWLLPAGMLWRGLRRRDRFVTIAGVTTAILTLVTNKPYLGWPRHPWDPMLLGILLTGIAVAVRRWLARGDGGIRHGITAQSLSAGDKLSRNLLAVSAGFLANANMPAHPTAAESKFSGGDSVGGGASSDF